MPIRLLFHLFSAPNLSGAGAADERKSTSPPKSSSDAADHLDPQVTLELIMGGRDMLNILRKVACINQRQRCHDPGDRRHTIRPERGGRPERLPIIPFGEGKPLSSWFEIDKRHPATAIQLILHAAPSNQIPSEMPWMKQRRRLFRIANRPRVFDISPQVRHL